MIDENDEQNRRATDRKSYRAIPFAAWISAVSLAWYVGVSWVNFRDAVFNNCHRVELRLAALDEYRLAHERADAERFERILRIEHQLSEFASSDAGQYPHYRGIRNTERGESEQ